MNRREIITGAAGLALTSFAASPNSGEFAKGAEGEREVKVCPIYMCMNQGSYATYYAMETQPDAMAPCMNPRMMIGPTNLVTGCAGTGCVSRSIRDSRQKGDDAVFHTKDDLAKNGCTAHATAFSTGDPGVILSREGVYEIKVTKGSSGSESTIRVRLREIVVIPSKCTGKDATEDFKKNPAVVIYDAVELADIATPLNPGFGDLDVPDKAVKDGHHFKLKVKSTKHDKLIFTLLCKK